MSYGGAARPSGGSTRGPSSSASNSTSTPRPPFSSTAASSAGAAGRPPSFASAGRSASTTAMGRPSGGGSMRMPSTSSSSAKPTGSGSMRSPSARPGWAAPVVALSAASAPPTPAKPIRPSASAWSSSSSSSSSTSVLSTSAPSSSKSYSSSPTTPAPSARPPTLPAKAAVATVARPPAPVAAAPKWTATVLYDYEAANDGDLDVFEGDTLTIIKRDGDWFMCDLNGRKGYVPATYVLEKAGPAAPPAMPSRPAAASPSSNFSSSPAPAAKSPVSAKPVFLGLDKRKDTTTKENFYLYMMSSPEGVVYRRVTEWRGLYVRLTERFPDAAIPEFPITKEGLLTNYTRLGEELAVWFDTVSESEPEVLRSELFLEFLKVTPRDTTYAMTAADKPLTVASPPTSPRLGAMASSPPPASFPKASSSSSSAPYASSSASASSIAPAAGPSVASSLRLSAVPRTLSANLSGRVKMGEGILDRHYEYQIDVVWDGDSFSVIRRYSEFHALQLKLLETFPVEAGANDPSTRTLPFLPGKVLFGRSQVHGVADQRMVELAKYLADVVRLETRISRCPAILEFLRPSDKDLGGGAARPKGAAAAAAAAAPALVARAPRQQLGPDDFDLGVPRMIQWQGSTKYVIEVMRATGSSTLYRTYEEVLEFHQELLESFPEQKAAKATRQLPFFPTRKMFGSEPLEDRKRDMHLYVQALMDAPESISRHAEVCRFIVQTLDDQLIGAEAEGELSFQQTEVVRNNVTRAR